MSSFWTVTCAKERVVWDYVWSLTADKEFGKQHKAFTHQWVLNRVEKLSGTDWTKGMFEAHDGIWGNSGTKGQTAVYFFFRYLQLTVDTMIPTIYVSRSSISLHCYKVILYFIIGSPKIWIVTYLEILSLGIKNWQSVFMKWQILFYKVLKN